MADGLNYNGIISDLKNNVIKNLYLFYGPENILIHNVLSLLEKRVINPDFKSLNYINIDGQNINFNDLVNACETLPFMAKKKLVVVNDCHFFKNKKSDISQGDNLIDNLCEYLPNIPETTILVFISDLDVDKRKKLYVLLKKNGDIAEFEQLKSSELSRWISKIFEKNAKKISSSDIAYLSERVSGSLEDAVNEANKLCSFAAEKQVITREDIEKVVPKSLENNIFQLVECISSKKPGQALYLFNEMLLDSEPIPIILTMIIRQYRLLLNAKLYTNKGYKAQDLASKLGVRPYVSSKLISTCLNYSEEQLECKLRYCLDVDESIKLGRMDQRIAIESMIVEFAR